MKRYAASYGKLAEWLKAAVLKTVDGVKSIRGFESPTSRQMRS